MCYAYDIFYGESVHILFFDKQENEGNMFEYSKP